MQARAAPPPRPPPPPRPAAPERQPVKLLTGEALIERLLPAALADRNGWAGDIHSAMVALGIEPSADNICAVVAVAAQESEFRADPSCRISAE